MTSSPNPVSPNATSADPHSPDPSQLRDVAVTIAGEICAYLREEVLGSHAPDEKSSPADLVTAIDRESEARIVARLGQLRPDDGVLGEEGSSIPGTSGVQWIIDPIDGTTNFVYGMPAFSVSIAATFNGELVAGAVGDPMHGEIFEAYLGGAARVNGLPLEARSTTQLDSAVIATGFGFDPQVRQTQAEIISRLISQIGNLRRFGSAALDLCWVAAGRVDGYWERGLNAWDYSAGVLIAREAGAVVTGGRAEEPNTTMVVAMAPGISAAMTSLLNASGAFDS